MMHYNTKPYRNTLHDFSLGEIITHPVRKTIMESDNNLFCLLTMNHHRVHLDNEYVKEHELKKVLVVGTYVFSLTVGITVADISGAAIANLEYSSVVHNAPVFIGDTLRAETEVLDICPSQSKSDRGVLYVETRAFNQRDEIVLTFKRKVLLPISEPGTGDKA